MSRNTGGVSGRILSMRTLREIGSSSCCVALTPSYSCLLGRPTSIDASTVDTKYAAVDGLVYRELISRPPSNIDLRDLSIDHDTKPKPLEEPTFATYLILRYKLGLVVAKVGAAWKRGYKISLQADDGPFPETAGRDDLS